MRGGEDGRVLRMKDGKEEKKVGFKFELERHYIIE